MKKLFLLVIIAVLWPGCSDDDPSYVMRSPENIKLIPLEPFSKPIATFVVETKDDKLKCTLTTSFVEESDTLHSLYVREEGDSLYIDAYTSPGTCRSLIWNWETGHYCYTDSCLSSCFYVYEINFDIRRLRKKKYETIINVNGVLTPPFELEIKE